MVTPLARVPVVHQLGTIQCKIFLAVILIRAQPLGRGNETNQNMPRSRLGELTFGCAPSLKVVFSKRPHAQPNSACRLHRLDFDPEGFPDVKIALGEWQLDAALLELVPDGKVQLAFE